MPSISDLIEGTPGSERAQVKGREIAKAVSAGRFEEQGYSIEIESIREIERGVELYARAWKEGEPVGFGKDGTVEIERFRFINPPVLVKDPNGDIVRTSFDETTGNTDTRVLREDPQGALRKSLLRAIRSVGKSGENIVPGKRGNTTTTVFPDPNVEVDTVDGWVSESSTESWDATRNGPGDNSNDSNTTLIVTSEKGGTSWTSRHAILLFDASDVAGDTVDSATMTCEGTASTDDVNDAQSYIVLAESAPASNTELVNGDFDSIVFTDLSDQLDITSWNIGSDNTFTLNATGETFIQTAVDGDGIVKLAMVEGHGMENEDPGASVTSEVRCDSADETGTDSDPALIIEHSTAFSPIVTFIG